MKWKEHNSWEANWWGNCANTIGEEIKQLAYAKKLGLRFTGTEKTHYKINLNGASVIDIGGGPVSLLLKTVNGGRRMVADPCEYPTWIYDRYSVAGIESVIIKAEELAPSALIRQFDECWMYNCLQHVDRPEWVVSAALSMGKVVRVCEPVNTRISDGHPHTFSKEWLDDHFGGYGKVEHVREHDIDGILYHGIFKGKAYENEK